MKTLSSPKRRILAGALANGFDKASLSLIQLCTLPLLMREWGPEGYGLWLMLLTLPSYLALSDVGISTAVGTTVTRHIALGRLSDARGLIQAGRRFIFGTTSTLIILSLCSGLFVIWTSTQQVFSPSELTLALLSFGLYAFLMSRMALITALYRGTHKYAFAMTASGLLILIEGAALLMIVSVGGGIFYAALGFLCVRALGVLSLKTLLFKAEPWIKDASFTPTKIRTLLPSSFAALTLSAAQVIMLQGMILTLGASAGAATAALFGAARMMSRLPLQLAGLFIRPSLPELTRAQSMGNVRLERIITRANLALACGITLPFGLGLITLGDRVFKSFTSHESLHGLFLPFAIASTLSAVHAALANPLIAQNRQNEFAAPQLIAALCVLIIVGQSHHPAQTAAWGTVGFEITALFFIFRAKQRGAK